MFDRRGWSYFINLFFVYRIQKKKMYNNILHYSYAVELAYRLDDECGINTYKCGIKKKKKISLVLFPAEI